MRFFPRHRKWPNTPHFFAIALTPSLHLVRSAASSIFNPTFFMLSSTCLLHVIFGRPRFCFPFTSSIIAFTLSSFLLITCSYHHTSFAFAILSNVFFKPNISISSSIFFLSTDFTPRIDLAMALSVLLKIVISYPSNAMFHFHITLLILRNYDKPTLSFFKKMSHVTTLPVL